MCLSVSEKRRLMGAVLADCVSLMWKQVEATDESSSAVCSIWHVNIDTLPEWILTSVHTVSVTARTCTHCTQSFTHFQKGKGGKKMFSNYTLSHLKWYSIKCILSSMPILKMLNIEFSIFFCLNCTIFHSW